MRSKHRASFLMNELSSIGYAAEELLAQFFASLFVSGEVESHEMFAMLAATMKRTAELVSPNGQPGIWPGLLPGGISEDWPFEIIDRDDPKYNEILTMREWDLLASCERHLYKGEHGAHAWTSVNRREESQYVKHLWNQAYDNVAGADDLSLTGIEIQTAHRVAAMLAVAAFGKEFLLK